MAEWALKKKMISQKAHWFFYLSMLCISFDATFWEKYAFEFHHEALQETPIKQTFCLHEYSPISFVDYSYISFIKVLFFSKQSKSVAHVHLSSRWWGNWKAFPVRSKLNSSGKGEL